MIEIKECDKCKENIKAFCIGKAQVKEGDIVYTFCDDCFEIVKDMSTNSLAHFCKKNSDYLKFKMDQAKKKREKKKSPWYESFVHNPS